MGIRPSSKVFFAKKTSGGASELMHSPDHAIIDVAEIPFVFLVENPQTVCYTIQAEGVVV